MSRKHAYHEAKVPFDGDPLLTVTRIVKSDVEGDFVLYEHDREWSLGVGVHARVTVYPDKTVVAFDGGVSEYQHEHEQDPSAAIHAALAGLPIEGWRVYGTATFELSRYLYGLPVPPEKPLATLFVPTGEVRIREGSVLVRAFDRAALDALRTAAEVAAGAAAPPAATPLALAHEIDTYGAEPYKASVEKALGEIRAQEYRKVILSRKVPIDYSLDMVESYVTGRRANAPSRSYLLRLDGLEAAGFSPETVAEVTAARDVFTTPLAGTRATHEDIMEELRLREELLADSKEIAEHAISVYVAFDELTMACDPTSVSVINFMIVSRRGAVQHLASRLRGKLLERCNPWHALAALFPAVTASGVPKTQSIDAIGRIEPEPRGLYAGCVMVCDQGGALDAALVLRSFYQREGRAWLQAGAGIMNMSRPERELEETREKMRSFARYLIEAS